MKTLSIKFKIIFLSLLLLPTLMMANEVETLTKLIDKKVKVITAVLTDKALNVEQQDAKLLEAIDGLIDFKLMAKLSLGKTYWASSSPDQLATYEKLFDKRVKQSYLDKLHLYSNETVDVYTGKQTKETRIEVPAVIIGKGDPVEMRYKFYRAAEGQWLVYDLEVAGVSIIQTYRSQFAEILKDSSFDAFLEKLKQTNL